MDARNRTERAVRETARRIVHLYYCDGDLEAVRSYFAPQMSWIGPGEGEFAADRDAAEALLIRTVGSSDNFQITDEHYNVTELSPDTWLCTGRIWISAASGAAPGLQASRLATLVLRRREEKLLCVHCHCSAPSPSSPPPPRERGGSDKPGGQAGAPQAGRGTDAEQALYRLAMESGSVVMYEYHIADDVFCSYDSRDTGRKGNRVVRHEVRNYRKALENGLFIHPEDAWLAIENICEGRAEVCEVRIVPPGGRDYLWYRITGKLLYSQGHPCQVVGTLQNIQEQKTALTANAEELRMNQSALQALSSIYMSIFHVDLPANHYYGVRLPDSSNVIIPRSGDYQREMQKYFTAYITPEDQERLLPYADPRYLIEHLRTPGQRLEAEFRHLAGESEPVWLRLEVHPVSMENGAVKTAIIAFRNITESRRRELDRRREEEQARKALEVAYAAANRANQAKSDFLSKMSHDMRTPMNAITGMTTIARQHLEDPRRLEDCLEKIHRSGNHLLSLINEVLDMSQIESGSFGLNEAATSLPQLLRETVDMLRPEMERMGHTFTVELGELPHGTVLADAARLRQILVNLLSNAMKYTPDGGRIHLSLEELDYASGAVHRYRFIVEDNGIGMTPEFLEKLYLPFQRAEDSRISSIQGTGLGLTITSNLVHMMDGSIHVESRLHQGTRFTVILSLKATDASPKRQAPLPDLNDAEFHVTGEPRVLLVEDNGLNREIARELLETVGILVEEAENGAQALERFQASEPGYYRMILMDIQMPVMDGYRCAKAIRSLDRADAAAVPIIALTANTFVEDVSRARQAGMDAHLSKPLETPKLFQVLRQWLTEP